MLEAFYHLQFCHFENIDFEFSSALFQDQLLEAAKDDLGRDEPVSPRFDVKDSLASAASRGAENLGLGV